MCKQSDSTKLLAIGLLNVADDDGYFFADARMIRNLIRPLDDDSRITTVSIRELSEIGYIELRNHDTHGQIGFIPSFLIHQVINKPKASKIKALFEYGSDTVLIRDEYSLERKGTGNKGARNGSGISCPISSDDSDILKIAWNMFPSKSRERSSKKQFAEAWRKTKNKPTIEILKESLSAWNKSEKWTEGFSEGAHIWIQNAQWDNIPDQTNDFASDELELATSINKLRESWAKIGWSAEDRKALAKYKGQFVTLTDEDWQLLKDFLNSSQEGYFRPDQRSKLCESFSGIWSTCERWKTETKYRTSSGTKSTFY